MPAETNDFRRVLASEGISNAGSMLSRLALPWLAALALDATPMQMSLLLVADVAAGALGSLVIGTLVDQASKRAVMIGADVLRAAVLAALAVLAWQRQISMPLLALTAALVGALGIAFELARSAWIAQSTSPRDLSSRNARLSAVGSASETGAFAIGGWIYQAFGAIVALVVDAFSYVASAACLWNMHRDTAPTAAVNTSTRRTTFSSARDGLAAIAVSPVLRTLAWLECLLALGGALAGTSYMIFVTRDLGFGTGTLGMIFATGGLGAIAGAAMAPRLETRIGRSRTMVLGLVLLATGSLCIPLAPTASIVGAVLLVTHQIVGDGGATLFQVHDRTLRQLSVPPDLLARADGGLRTLGQIATLVGAIGGGWLATALGTRDALALVALLNGIAAVVAWRRLPTRN